MGRYSQDVDKVRILDQDTNDDKTGMRNNTTVETQELPAEMSTEIISVVATVTV